MVLGKLDKVIINKTHEFNCYEYHKVGQIPTDSFSVVISAEDFQMARNAMENINTIDIVMAMVRRYYPPPIMTDIGEINFSEQIRIHPIQKSTNERFR